MVFHWRLSDSKSPQISRILLSILAVFNNAVVWMISTRPPTSKSPSLFNNPWVTGPKALITIGVIVIFMFHSLLLLSLLLLLLLFIISCEFFTPALIDGLLLASDWQQAYWILLSILANLNNVWMVSIHPPISNSSTHLSSLWRLFQEHKLQLASLSPSCPFSVLWQGPSIYLSFRFFFKSLPCGPPGWQIPLIGWFSKLLLLFLANFSHQF